MEVAQAIDITAEQRRTVLALLERHLPGTKAWVYGSRAKWTSTPQSDLDLVVFSKPEQRRQVGDLREAFDESNLPFRVDLFVWSDVPRSFRQQIEAKHVVLQRNDTRSRPALHCRIAKKTRILKELICYTRDGEWGEGASHDDLLPMRVVRGTDFGSVRHGGVAGVPTRYIRRDVAAKKTLRPWDILIETAGGSKNRSTGRTLLVHPRILKDSDNSVTCASFARIVRIDPALAHPPYVYWYLQHLYSLGEMERHQVQHTGVARFQFTNFAANVEIPLPSIPEQEAIAHILGTLDDKIELNRRMNATLEKMMRTLFKSWFIDFDPVRAKNQGRGTGLPRAISDLFPSRLVEYGSSEAPEGWGVSTIGQEVETVGGATPSTKEPAYWANGDYCWATPKDLSTLSSPVLVETARKISADGVKRISSGLLPAETVLLSSRAPIGYLAITTVPTAVNQGFIAMVCNRRLPNLYVLFWCEENLEYIRSISGGSTFPEISKRTFRTVPIVVPLDAVLAAYTDIVRPLYDRIVANTKECATLAEMRDRLLPELGSGSKRLCEQDGIVGTVT